LRVVVEACVQHKVVLNGEGMIQDRRAQTVSKLEEGSVRRRLR